MGQARIKFPCGYEEELKDWNYGCRILRGRLPDKCPIHGDKCNNIRKKAKIKHGGKTKWQQ